MWPFTRIQTFTEGLPVTPAFLNRLQDGVNQVANDLQTLTNRLLAATTHPCTVAHRLISTGTWTVGTLAPGSIAESVNARACNVVLLNPPPIGSRITGAAVKWKDGAGTSLLRFELFAQSFSESSFSPRGQVDSIGTGAVEIVPLALSPSNGFILAQGDRLYAKLSTQGGGAAERRVYELYLTHTPP